MGNHDNQLKMMEDAAGEFVSLALEICEERISATGASATPPQAALPAAVIAVQCSLNTFLAVAKLANQSAER